MKRKMTRSKTRKPRQAPSKAVLARVAEGASADRERLSEETSPAELENRDRLRRARLGSVDALACTVGLAPPTNRGGSLVDVVPTDEPLGWAISPDWLSCTISMSGISKCLGTSDFDVALGDVIKSVRSIAVDWLKPGLDVEWKEADGINFYETRVFGKSLSLGKVLVHINYGGNSRSINIVFPGSWFACLKDISKGCRSMLTLCERYSAKITRFDLALDFYDGRVTMDSTVEAYDRRPSSFSHGSQASHRPRVSQVGDWGGRNADGRPNSRTLYVGARESAIMHRIYEKGHQLLDLSNAWLRHEVVFKPVDVVLPHSLLDSREWVAWFGGVCPYCKNLVQGKRILTAPRIGKGDVEQAVAFRRWSGGLRDAYGPVLKALVESMNSRDREAWSQTPIGGFLSILLDKVKASDRFGAPFDPLILKTFNVEVGCDDAENLDDSWNFALDSDRRSAGASATVDQRSRAIPDREGDREKPF